MLLYLIALIVLLLASWAVLDNRIDEGLTVKLFLSFAAICAFSYLLGGDMQAVIWGSTSLVCAGICFMFRVMYHSMRDVRLMR